MDPQKATDAACRFLKKLYGIYGDWNLALAAYNAGPGTINRAIERSGNQRSYWAIRSSLPSETQGYVPTFIAAAYLMTFHAEHNLMPAPAKIHNAQLDTMCLKRGLHMSTIAKALDWELQQIKDLNPIYKTEFIPASIKKRCVTGPLDKITLLVGAEDSLYLLENPSQAVNPFTQDTTMQLDSAGTGSDSLSANYAFHKVKTGETLKSIALKYSVSADELMEWNALQTTNIYVGQRLTLKKINTVKQTPITPVQIPKPKKYYTVKSGDTLSRIATKNNLTLAQLKKLNPGVGNMIRVGDRIRVK
jgi:membrane-bound lytic murein transglycosylase D